MARPARRRFFVDRHVQGALLRRACVYWFACLFGVFLGVLIWRSVGGPARAFWVQADELWHYYGPALVITVILLPLLLVDMVRFSNRFAGPLFRLRRAMRQLADGEHVDPIHFRDADFWKDLALDFNRVAERLQAQSKAAAQANLAAWAVDTTPTTRPSVAQGAKQVASEASLLAGKNSEATAAPSAARGKEPVARPAQIVHEYDTESWKSSGIT